MNTQELKIQKIRNEITNRLKDYKYYNYNLPSFINITVKQGIVNTKVMGVTITVKKLKDFLVVGTNKAPLGIETKRRITTEINQIVCKHIEVEDDFEMKMETINYDSLPNTVREYLTLNSNVNICDLTLCNIINAIPNKIVKAYNDAYSFESNSIVKSKMYSNYANIFRFHDSNFNFNNYILTLVKKLDNEDLTTVLNAVEEARYVKQENFLDLLVEAYIYCFGLGKIGSPDKKEIVISTVNNTIISSL